MNDKKTQTTVHDIDGVAWCAQTLPQNATFNNMGMNHTDGVNIPVGTRCGGYVDLRWARNFKIAEGLVFNKLDLTGAAQFVLPKTLTLDTLNLSETEGVVVFSGVHCVSEFDASYAKSLVLPERFNVRLLNLQYTDGVNVKHGTKCEVLNLQGAKNFILADGIMASDVNMNYTENVKIPFISGCKKISLINANGVVFSQNTVVDELDLSGSENVVIPAGVSCHKLNVSGAKSVKICSGAHIGQIIGVKPLATRTKDAIRTAAQQVKQKVLQRFAVLKQKNNARKH